MTVRVLIFGAAVAMMGSAAYVLVLALRAKHPQEDWSVLAVHVALRAGGGFAALWLAFGGGAIAGWTLAVLLLAQVAWREVARRQHPA
jgi:hypothetical protein